MHTVLRAVLLSVVLQGGVADLWNVADTCTGHERYCGATHDCVDYRSFASSYATPCRDPCYGKLDIRGQALFLCGTRCAALSDCPTASLWVSQKPHDSKMHITISTRDAMVIVIGPHFALSLSKTNITYKSFAVTDPAVKQALVMQAAAHLSEPDSAMLFRLDIIASPLSRIDGEIITLDILHDIACREDFSEVVTAGIICAEILPLGCSTIVPRGNGPVITMSPKAERDINPDLEPAKVQDLCPASCGVCPGMLSVLPPKEAHCLNATMIAICTNALSSFAHNHCILSYNASSPCHKVRYCPQIRKIRDARCAGTAPGRLCKEAQSIHDGVACEVGGYLWEAEQSDDTHSWCVRRETGEVLSGTKVALSDSASLVCNIPQSRRRVCTPQTHLETILVDFSDAFCTAGDYLSMPLTIYRVIPSWNISFTSSKRLDSLERGALAQHINKVLPIPLVHFLGIGDPGVTRFTMSAVSLIPRMEPPEGGVGLRPIVDQSVLSKGVASIMGTEYLEQKVLEVVSSKAMQAQFGALEMNVIRSDFTAAVGYRNEAVSVLRAETPSFTAVFSSQETSIKPDRPGTTRRVTNVSITFSPAWWAAQPDTHINWGIYEAKEGSCPTPDSNVFDPLHLGSRWGCYAGSTAERRDNCRVGDMVAKLGFLTNSFPEVVEDELLPVDGWASVEGKVLVIGSTPPICATISRTVRATDTPHLTPSAHQTLTADFSSPSAEVRSLGLAGRLSLHQLFPGTDTLIKVALQASKVVTNLSYHISTKGMEEYSWGCADYDPSDLYDPFAVVGGQEVPETPSRSACLKLHPIVPNTQSGCALGDLTPQLRGLRDVGVVPVGRSAVHTQLDVANANPALRNEENPAQQGRTLVVIHDNNVVACAPLLLESESGSIRQTQTTTSNKWWIYLSFGVGTGMFFFCQIFKKKNLSFFTVVILAAVYAGFCCSWPAKET